MMLVAVLVCAFAPLPRLNVSKKAFNELTTGNVKTVLTKNEVPLQPENISLAKPQKEGAGTLTAINP
jgi:hypothetical protein